MVKVIPIVTAKLDTSGDEWGDNTLLRIDVDGRSYGFTVHQFDERTRNWLLEMLPRQFEDVYNSAYNKGKREVRDQIKNALQIK